MLKVALLGFGVVGSGVAQVITENQDRIRHATGDGIEIRYILDLRDFPDSPFADRIVHDFSVIVNDPQVDVVVEMMGGAHPASDYTRAALEAGKHVVTSNKEVVATFGTELLALAAQHGVRYLFEASVGGGIPVLRPLACDMAANRVHSIDGILNGTTNYILTRMRAGGVSFATALSEAQEKGYAERDPSADVDGIDAVRKIAILTAVSTGIRPTPTDIPAMGIRAVTSHDVEAAAAVRCAVKLIGHMSCGADGKPTAWVAPCFVPLSNPLAVIDDVFNGILVDTDMLGQTLFYGRGAGKLPTAGAVVSDLIDIAAHPYDATTAPHWTDGTLVPDETPYRYALIFEGADTLPAHDDLQTIMTAAWGGACLSAPLSGAALEKLLAALAVPPTACYRCLGL